MSSIDRLIPIRAAFALIGVRPTKGYDLVAKCQLAAVRLGARSYVRESELNRFLDEVPRPLDPASASNGRKTPSVEPGEIASQTRPAGARHPADAPLKYGPSGELTYD